MLYPLCCTVPTCWYNIYRHDPLSISCLYHYQMRTTMLSRVYCTIPACTNKTRSTTASIHCAKHFNTIGACCSHSCTSPCVNDTFYCSLHSNIVVCLLVSCCSTNVSTGEVYCVKHVSSLDVCSIAGCLSDNCPYSDYCLYHYKHRRLCENEDCFTPPRRKNRRFCIRHSENTLLCSVRKCRKVRTMVTTMCDYHTLSHTPCTVYLDNAGVSGSEVDAILTIDKFTPLSGTFYAGDPQILTNLF